MCLGYHRLSPNQFTPPDIKQPRLFSCIMSGYVNWILGTRKASYNVHIAEHKS